MASDKIPLPQCRRCSECIGQNHHWLDGEGFGDGLAETYYACKKKCKECGQPMLREGQEREHPDDYRHASGCPLDDSPTVLHCWEDGSGSTCMLPDGHEGEHVFTPDDQIGVRFTEEVG